MTVILQIPLQYASLPPALRYNHDAPRTAINVIVILPIVTVSELNRRDHWAVRAKRCNLHRSTAYIMLRQALYPALPCRITLTRVAPRVLDGDNCVGALKAVRDGVADWLGVPDNDPRIDWQYAQARGPASVLVAVVVV